MLVVAREEIKNGVDEWIKLNALSLRPRSCEILDCNGGDGGIAGGKDDFDRIVIRCSRVIGTV